MDELEYYKQKALHIACDDDIKKLVKNDTDIIRLKRFIANNEKWQKMNKKERAESNRHFLKSYDIKHGTSHLKEYDRIQTIWDNTTKELRSK